MLNVPGIARARTLIDAIGLDYSQKNPAGVLPIYEKALAYGNVTGLEETREQLSQSALRFLNADVPAETTTPIVSRAIEELTTSATEEPSNTRRLYFLGRTLRMVGELDASRAVFDEALAINPNRQIMLYEVGQSYMTESAFNDAADAFMRAYQAEPENDTAFTYYAATLMHAERFAEGEKLLIDRFGTTTIDNELLFAAYERIGRLDKIAAIFELRLANMAPADDAGARASLGGIYLRLGRTDDAIAQFERAAELAPSFAAQAQQIIQAIREGKSVRIRQ